MNAREIAATRLRAAAEHIPDDSVWVINAFLQVASRLTMLRTPDADAVARALLGDPEPLARRLSHLGSSEHVKVDAPDTAAGESWLVCDTCGNADPCHYCDGGA